MELEFIRDMSVDELAPLARELGATQKKIDRALKSAVGDTTRQLRTRISALIREKIVIKKRDLDPHINIRKPRGNPEGAVTLKHTGRLPLRDFGARQTKRGVSYKIDKGGKRQKIASGFLVTSIGGHAFKRIGVRAVMQKGRYAGKMRERITKLHGISPWAVFKKNDLEGPTEGEAADLLDNNIRRRLRLIIYRLTGEVDNG